MKMKRVLVSVRVCSPVHDLFKEVMIMEVTIIIMFNSEWKA